VVHAGQGKVGTAVLKKGGRAMWRIWLGFSVGFCGVLGMDILNFYFRSSGWITDQFLGYHWGMLKNSQYIGHNTIGLDIEHLHWWNQASMPVALAWGAVGALVGFTINRRAVTRREHQEMADYIAAKKKKPEISG
jgi:hypothetical protein